MLFLLSLVFVFHILVITQIIPYTIVWGGRLKSTSEMYVFELVSIFINSILFTTLLIKGEILKVRIPIKIIHFILWFFVFIFLLNTLGNIVAKDILERLIFTPLTFISAILLIIILKTKKRIEILIVI